MQQRRPGQRSCALCSVQHLAHRRSVQLLHSQVAQSGFVDPRTPPKTGKEANILHHHSWLLTGDSKDQPRDSTTLRTHPNVSATTGSSCKSAGVTSTTT